MTDLEVPRWLRTLDEEGAVALARDLLAAEAGLHGLPLDVYSMSGRVKTRDQGIDGRSNFPDQQGILVPTGPQVWQVKSRTSAPSAQREFDAKNHNDLVKSIRNGDDYVLFWTNDPTDPELTAVSEVFEEKVTALRPDAITTVLSGVAIERLLWAHLGVMRRFCPIPIGNMVSLDVWGQSGDFDESEFFADDLRQDDLIPRVRSHIASREKRPTALHLVGDTGVGKSRLVYEALNVDGVRERALVAPDAESIEWALLSEVAQSQERHLILVVDDCDADTRGQLTTRSDMARGRVRLVTIGAKLNRHGPSDTRYPEVLPLETGVSKQIALSYGLDEPHADMVARMTEGYPGIARRLSEAIRYGTGNQSLIDRLEHEEIGSVLESMLPVEDADLLGMLALFERLGYEEDVEPEFDLACEAFGVDPDKLRAVCERELKKFVSSAGRYRRVTPRLFALWLGREFIRRRQGTFPTQLNELPDSLQEQVVLQMREFAGDPEVEAVFAQLLGTPPFTDGTLADVDESAARLLHVASVVVPGPALLAIEHLFTSSSRGEIRELRGARQLIVWALQELLWSPEMFSRAADALLLLAMEDDADRNIAAGVVEASFRVFLGGTGLPFVDRVVWARERLHDPTWRDGAPFLINGLGVALSIHEWRDVHRGPGQPEPEEWHPLTLGDELAARGAAWDLLFEVAAEDAQYRDRVAEVVAGALPRLVTRTLVDRMTRDLSRISWSTASRSKLGSAMTSAARLTALSPEIKRQLGDVVRMLQGATWQDRLGYLFSLDPWQVTNDTGGEADTRGSLTELAEELVAAERDRLLEAIELSRRANPQTAVVFFERVGELASSDDDLLRKAEAIDPVAMGAVEGLFVGMARSAPEAWSREVLSRWIAADRLGPLVLPAVHALPASDERAEVALKSVERGYAPPVELGRLLYGAWVRPLSAEALDRLLSMLAAAHSYDVVEAALGMLSQWLEVEENVASDSLRATALSLIQETTRGDERVSPMADLYRGLVLTNLNLTPEEELTYVCGFLGSARSQPDSQTLRRLEVLARVIPAPTVAAVVAMLAPRPDRDVGWHFALRPLYLLTRLACWTSPELVVSVIESSIEKENWPGLIDHLDLSDSQPDRVFEKLIGSDPGETFEAKAAFKFLFPDAFSGARSIYLVGRRSVAEEWKLVTESPALFQWLEGVTGELDRQIEQAKRYEAERGW